MSLMQSAFIRINTPELRGKLFELGYKEGRNHRNPIYYDCLYFYKWKFIMLNDDDIEEWLNDEKNQAVDCGISCTLFLAIAAIRDGTDRMQWFTNGKRWYLCCEEGDYFLYRIKMMGYHKASVEGIIEHFKGKTKR